MNLNKGNSGLVRNSEQSRRRSPLPIHFRVRSFALIYSIFQRLIFAFLAPWREPVLGLVQPLRQGLNQPLFLHRVTKFFSRKAAKPAKGNHT